MAAGEFESLAIQLRLCRVNEIKTRAAHERARDAWKLADEKVVEAERRMRDFIDLHTAAPSDKLDDCPLPDPLPPTGEGEA